MLYKLVWRLLRLVFVPLGLKAEGLQNIPGEGPVIIAANHIAILDPVMIALVVKRPIFFMAKEEVFKFKPVAGLLARLNVFPVKRGTPDKKAIRQGLDILKNGDVLGIFPEGTRNRNHEELKPHHGTAMYAIKTGAPVIPVSVHGTDHIIPCGWIWPLKVVAGEPLVFKGEGYERLNTAAMEDVSRQVMEQIFNLN